MLYALLLGGITLSAPDKAWGDEYNRYWLSYFLGLSCLIKSCLHLISVYFLLQLMCCPFVISSYCLSACVVCGVLITFSHSDEFLDLLFAGCSTFSLNHVTARQRTLLSFGWPEDQGVVANWLYFMKMGPSPSIITCRSYGMIMVGIRYLHSCLFI